MNFFVIIIFDALYKVNVFNYRESEGAHLIKRQIGCKFGGKKWGFGHLSMCSSAIKKGSNSCESVVG